MRRVPVLVALLIVTGMAAVFASVPLRTGAQLGTPAAMGQGFVGAWQLTTTTPFGPSQSLLTFMADGTVLFSDRPTLPAAGGFPVTFQSAGHGAWEQTGPTTAAATWVEFISDGEGNFLVTVTDTVEVALGADGASFSGPFSGTVADPSGNVLFVGTGTVEARRITVQPLATPSMGTPTA